MTRRRGARITVLAEDELLDRFARKALENLGYHRSEIYSVSGDPRAGRGSGTHWVESQYPHEVKTIREKIGSQRVALLVGTDADKNTVAKRSKFLASALTEAGLTARGNSETIAHWIPRRSIETWGLALTGQSADEETPYKSTSQAKNIDWEKAASTFVKDYRSHARGASVDRLPSLLAAYHETRRLEYQPV